MDKPVIKIEASSDGVSFKVPGVGRWEGQVDHKQVRWLNNHDSQLQIIVFSEDDLDLDDPNKKYKRLTLTLEEGP